MTYSHCGPSISYEKTGPGQLYDISKEKDVMTPQRNLVYLPTRRAVAGGDYSAVNHSIGPVGGRLLVDESVKAINSMWP